MEEKKVIVRCLRVELIKPLNYTWDEAGSLLRGQRSVMHRLMNAAVLGYLDDRNLPKGEKPKVSVYLRIGQTLEAYREWARKHKDPGVKRFSELQVGTGIQSAIDQIGADAFQRWRKGKGNEAVPSFGKGQPIPVRAQESRLRKDPKGFVLECKLLTGSADWHQLALAPSSGRHHETLRNLTENKEDWSASAIKLDYDERKKKWYALISYKRPLDKTDLDPEKILVVHRGGHNFVACMSSGGQWSTVSGRKLLAQKKQFKARRRDMQQVTMCERGDGAKGHGVARRSQHCDSISDKESRAVKTFCQQTAARVVQLALQWGCGTVVIGDYGGADESEDRAVRRFVPRVPLYQLKTSIANALQVKDIALVEISESYVSQTCPVCDTLDAGAHNTRTGVFHCKSCGFNRPADWVSAKMMMRRAAPTVDVYDRQLKQQLLLAKSLKARETEQQGSEVEECADSTALARGQVHSRTGKPDIQDNLETHDPPLRSPTVRSRETKGGEKREIGEKPTGKARQKRTARKTSAKPAKRKRSLADV